MRIIHKQLAGLIMVIGILVGAICLPVSLANAETPAITFNKLADGENYKETMFTIVDGNGSYNVLVRANITRDGIETLIILNGTLLDATNTTVTMSVAIPDTLVNHPIVGKVEAIHVNISEENVENLVYVIVPIAFLGALLTELLLVIPLEIVNLITRYAPFVWASVPYVLETLLVSDNNDDDTGTRGIIPDFLGLGSFDLFLPYSPVAALPSGNHYYVATGKSWWNIQKHEVRAPWPLDWLVLFTYFSATKIGPTDQEHKPPVALFDWRPRQPVVGEQVVFTSTSYPQDPRSVILETGYHWWLGEGSERTDKNFTFVYNSPGDYNVTLKVTDNNTLTSNVTQTINVQPAPSARLRVVPDHLELSVQSGQHATAPFAVLESLNETSLQDVAFLANDLQSHAGETIPSSNISFDNNGITVPKGSYENVTVDVYAPPALLYGWYSGNMTATSENGGNATISLDVRIFGPPIANFTWSPLKPWVGGPVTFNAESSSSNDSSIVMYSWDFGDFNTTSISDPILNHTYSVIGAYNVTLTVTNLDNLNDTTSRIVNVLQHDVAVVDVVPYRNWVYEGRPVPVNVTLLNCGDFDETVTVDLYYDLAANQQIGTIVADLSPNETRMLTFVWNTSGVQRCHNYTITARASIPFDSNITNNVKEGMIRIKVRLMGDVNGDGKVDGEDIALAALAFGTVPGDPKWNPDVDMNNDNKIDGRDIVMIALNFGMC